MKSGRPVPFCAGCPLIADVVPLTMLELAVTELSITELATTELATTVLGAKKSAVVVVSSGE